MSVNISYKKQFALGIMFLFVIAAIVEAFAWTYDYTVSLCSVMQAKAYQNYELRRQLCDDALSLRTEYDEGTDWLVQKPKQYTKTININEEGFRGPEITKEKPSDTFRIFIVGGSTVLGLRSPDDRTISGYLQKLFDESKISKKVEVINAGQNAFGSTQELLWIKNKVLKYEPDVIIVYDGANDIYNPIGFKYGVFPNSTKPSWQVEFKNFHAQYFPFYKTVDMIYDIGKKAEKRFSKWTFDDSNLEHKISVWKNNGIEVCELGRREGFEVILTLQPLLGTGNKKLTPTEQDLFNYWDHDIIIPQYLKFFAELDDIKKKCENVADLSRIFDDVKEDLYFDGAHTGYQGDEIIAKRLFELSYPIVLRKISDDFTNQNHVGNIA